MSKSLGQVAHEAFEVRYENSRDDESWTCESERQQQAWQAAADAVVREARAQLKATVDEWGKGMPDHTYFGALRAVDALEALQEARDE